MKGDPMKDFWIVVLTLACFGLIGILVLLLNMTHSAQDTFCMEYSSETGQCIETATYQELVEQAGGKW